MGFFELFDVTDAEVRAEMMATLRLAHGLCCSLTQRKLYAHAWVEEVVPRDEPARPNWPEHVVWQGMATDDGGRAWFAVEREWFYSAYMVETRTVYNLAEMMRHNLATGHYGPWVPLYREHTGGGGITARLDGAPVLGVVKAPK
jgi:hypothetical protein